MTFLQIRIMSFLQIRIITFFVVFFTKNYDCGLRTKAKANAKGAKVHFRFYSYFTSRVG
jgi:hypothetical protein